MHLLRDLRSFGLRQEQHWAGELLREPAYEHPTHAPIDLLRYLIDNAGDSRLLAHGNLRTMKSGPCRHRVNTDPLLPPEF